MVEETVRQDEIELLPRGGAIVSAIGNNECWFESPARAFIVSFVEIGTEIVALSKVPRVCARSAPHVEHTTDASQVIVREHRANFCSANGACHSRYTAL